MFIFRTRNFPRCLQDFKKQAKENYEDFRKKANQEYTNWMSQAWEWHDKIAPMPRPKDEMLPPIIYNKGRKQKEPKSIPYEETAPAPKPQPQLKPIVPIREEEGEYKTASFQFFGTDATVRLPKDSHFNINGRLH